MNISFKNLSIPLLDDALEGYRKAASTPPPAGGWVKAIRQAIGMTKEQLAQRLDLSPSTINTLERSEARGRITLESLQRLAQGMDCHMVYAIVPNDGKTLDEIVRRRAEAMASKQLARVSHSMRLEEQGLNEKQEKRQLARLVEALMSGSRRRLWR